MKPVPPRRISTRHESGLDVFEKLTATGIRTSFNPDISGDDDGGSPGPICLCKNPGGFAQPSSLLARISPDILIRSDYHFFSLISSSSAFFSSASFMGLDLESSASGFLFSADFG